MRNGLIQRLEIEGHEVQINRLTWLTWDADAKKDFAVRVANYCARHGRSRVAFVDVFDSHSGKKLAHYGLLGFEVF